MANEYYKPGSFWRICDRTGFKVRAERSRKEWTGLIVRDQSWELRNAQDFVTGVPDDQNVPEPRPQQVNVFIEGSGAAQFQVFIDEDETNGLAGFQVITNNVGTECFFVDRIETIDPASYPSSGL